MSWSKEQVTILINEYRKYPCLYAVKNVLYKNKHARKDAVQKIVEKLKPLKPDINSADVKTKFGGIRTNFLCEHRKHENSKESGRANDVYKPNIWYYNLMTFVLEHALPQRKVPYYDYDSSFDCRLDRHKNEGRKQGEFESEMDFYANDESHHDRDKEIEFVNVNVKRDEFFFKHDSEALLTLGGVSANEGNTSPCTSAASGSTCKRRRKNEEDYFKVASNLSMQPVQKDDQISSFVKLVECKLRKIENVDIYENVEMEIFNFLNTALASDRKKNNNT